MIDFTVKYELKGVPYSEFELGHAFAFRSFDLERILQRRFFAEFGFGADLTDKEILQSFDCYVNAKLKPDDELERNAEKLLDLLISLDIYLKRIEKHCKRLDRYIHAAARAIADGEVANVEEIRSRYKRAKRIRNFYGGAIYSFIKEFRDNTDKAFKKINGEVQHVYRKIFADRLKTARQATGLTQAEFGASVGLSQRAVSTYEIATREPSLATLVKIAQKLKRPVGWFLGVE